MIPTWTCSGTREGITPLLVRGVQTLFKSYSSLLQVRPGRKELLILDLDAKFGKNAGLEPIFNMYAGFAVFF